MMWIRRCPNRHAPVGRIDTGKLGRAGSAKVNEDRPSQAAAGRED
jgi:hypothetical protein